MSRGSRESGCRREDVPLVSAVMPTLPQCGALVPDLHVVDFGVDAGLIVVANEIVAEQVIVDQATVPDGAVQDLDLGLKCNPGGQGGGGVVVRAAGITSSGFSLQRQALASGLNLLDRTP